MRAIVLLLAGILPAGSGTPQAPTTPASATAPAPPGDDEPVLRIDGRPISGDDFGLWLLRTKGEELALTFGRRHFAVEREARRLGIDVPPEEVASEVERVFRERIAGAFLGSRDSWLAELARTGRSERGLRRQRLLETKAELQARNLAAVDRVVPGFLIEREWELRHGRKGRRYDLQMIKFKVVVPTLADRSRDEWKVGRQAAMDAAESKARGVRERVLAGEEFGLLATQFSDDPDTRDHRGRPSGGFAHVGWPSSFLDRLEKLEPGAILEPTYARGGFWIVKLRSVAVTPLESVRRAIEADLLARGPEPYEIGMAQDRVAEGVEVRTLPSLWSEPTSGELPSAFEPVLLIDGEPIRRADYARWILEMQGEILVPQFVEEWAIERTAHEAGVTVDEREIADRVRERVQRMIDSGYHGDRPSWLAYLALSGRSEDATIRDLAWRTRFDLLAEKLLVRERRVTPEEVRLRWKDVYGHDGHRVEASLIQVMIRPPNPPEGLTREGLEKLMADASAQARERADEIVKRLEAGEDFAEIARRTSDDAKTKDAGGALPDRFRPDEWSEEIAAAVAALEPGRWTKPILWASDWLILKVTARRKVAFEEVEKEIEAELRTRRPSQAEITFYRNDIARPVKYEMLPALVR